jgi:hypothetical protein
MTELTFVNLFGQPVSVAPVKVARVAKPKEACHMGWLATGVSPKLIALGQQDPKFELDNFLRSAKREKIRVKPYFSYEAARNACDLAERFGWAGCQTLEKKVD